MILKNILWKNSPPLLEEGQVLMVLVKDILWKNGPPLLVEGQVLTVIYIQLTCFYCFTE